MTQKHEKKKTLIKYTIFYNVFFFHVFGSFSGTIFWRFTVDICVFPVPKWYRKIAPVSKKVDQNWSTHRRHPIFQTDLGHVISVFFDFDQLFLQWFWENPETVDLFRPILETLSRCFSIKVQKMSKNFVFGTTCSPHLDRLVSSLLGVREFWAIFLSML